MKIVIAPDKFKASLTSYQAAEAIEEGVLDAHPDADTILVPLADGGEGTVDAVVHATNGWKISHVVTGPLGERVNAFYGLVGPREGIVEMASASGLELVPPSSRNPMLTTTYGTGELIKAVLRNDCHTVIVGVGGSATTDCGMGMAQALGVKFFDANNELLGTGSGQYLSRVEWIDMMGLDERVKEAEIRVATDVSNLLYGPEGAAHVYASQKGADSKMVEELDNGLVHFAAVIKRDMGIDIAGVPGGGAAGGLGAGSMAFLGAALESGIDLIMRAVDFAGKLEGADLVITGEGKIDKSTAYGKVVAGVARAAKKYDIPVIAIGGQVVGGKAELKRLGVRSFYSLVNKDRTPEQTMSGAATFLREAAAKAISARKI